MRTYQQRVKIQACTGFEPMTAQLVERCTGIAEVMGSNPVQAEIFFRPYFHYCQSSAHYCEDHFHSRLYSQFKYITFIYS